MLGARLHRLLHFKAEAAAARFDRIAGDELAIEPGRAFGRSLRLDGKVGADGKRGPRPAAGILEGAQLDDGAGRGIAGRLDVGKLDMVGAAVRAVDHRIGGAAAPISIVSYRSLTV